ncbi:hypothetical protein B0H13DRAFT_2410245 [Mycena leptocephala]|nr:hypothetical protein B0H13DRAFT_2410245 [Mycena leptocephala]
MSLPTLDTITGYNLLRSPSFLVRWFIFDFQGTSHWDLGKLPQFLYMAELMQARYYFRHFKHDDWKLKTFVSVAFLVDTVSTVGDYACVYLYTIKHAGDPVYLADQNWGVPLYLFTTAIIAILVQSFLVVRYWWLNILVTLLNFFLIIVAFGGSMAVGVIIAMFPAFRERDKVKIPATIWLVTEAVADLSIAAAMLWELRKARPTLNESRSVLDRLVALTIRTGTASATLAVAALIAFLLREDNNVSVGIAYTLGRVYVLSMFANLNVRRSGRSASVGTDEMSSPAGLDTLTFPSSATTDEFRSSHIPHTTVQVDIDPKQDVTLTGTWAKNVGDDSRTAEIETTPSNSLREQWSAARYVTHSARAPATQAAPITLRMAQHTAASFRCRAVAIAAPPNCRSLQLDDAYRVTDECNGPHFIASVVPTPSHLSPAP